MSAKELKVLIEVETALGYTGDELKQFITEERMRLYKEKEREREEKEQQCERQRELECADKERAFELDKLKVENEAKTAAEVERAKIEAAKSDAEAARETE